MGKSFWGTAWPPQYIQHQCQYCGLWTTGKFKNRRDVPLAEVEAHFSRLVGEPITGSYQPALRHPEHSRWEETGRGEPYSGGSCDDCNQEALAEQRERIARLRTAMTPPEPPAAEQPTGTDGASGEGESNG